MTVFGPHYDAKHIRFTQQYCYYVKSYYRKSFSSVQPVVKQRLGRLDGTTVQFLLQSFAE